MQSHTIFWPQGFDTESLQLLPLRMELFCGFIFVTGSDQTPELSAFLGDLGDQLSEWFGEGGATSDMVRARIANDAATTAAIQCMRRPKSYLLGLITLVRCCGRWWCHGLLLWHCCCADGRK